MSSLDQPIRQLAANGVQITIWPTSGGYQANVAERVGSSWTSFTAADPIEALGTALRQRVARVPDREVVTATEMQIDLEEAIAAAPGEFVDREKERQASRLRQQAGLSPVDEFDGLLA